MWTFALLSQDIMVHSSGYMANISLIFGQQQRTHGPVYFHYLYHMISPNPNIQATLVMFSFCRVHPRLYILERDILSNPSTCCSTRWSRISLKITPHDVAVPALLLMWAWIHAVWQIPLLQSITPGTATEEELVQFFCRQTNLLGAESVAVHLHSQCLLLL
jgi:hypothetical protein